MLLQVEYTYPAVEYLHTCQVSRILWDGTGISNYVPYDHFGPVNVPEFEISH